MCGAVIDPCPVPGTGHLAGHGLKGWRSPLCAFRELGGPPRVHKIGYYKQVADLRRPRQHQPQSRVIYKWELKRTPLLLPTVLLSASLPHPPLRLPNVHRHSSNKHSHPSLETVSRSCRTLHYQAWPLGGTPTRCWASRQRGGSAARKAAGNCPSQSIALEGRGQRELFSL